MTQRRRNNAVPKDARKKDTREKITLGGLIVKAGLREADRAFLLGALIEAARIAPASRRYAELRAGGQAVFDADKVFPNQPVDFHNPVVGLCLEQLDACGINPETGRHYHLETTDK